MSSPQSRETMIQCSVCGRTLKQTHAFPGVFVRPALVELIRRTKPDWKDDDWICADDLNRYRSDYAAEALEKERGELSELEQEVLAGLAKTETIAADMNADYDRRLTLPDRISDRMAEFGGSWWFLGVFTGVLITWIGFNLAPRVFPQFDPPPFILLNLILSCLAAVQAPIIMMSQRRQESRDRLRAENDFRVNLKAELEIRHLHAKFDLLLTHQWQRLLEIQKNQTDLMRELTRDREENQG